MHYKKTRRDVLKLKIKATEVLYKKMIFYSRKAQEIADFLIQVIESGKTARGDLLVSIHKDMHRFNALAIECASKLAPYQAPRLESIEVKQKSTVKFVVKAPMPIASTQDWLKQVTEAKVNGKLIDVDNREDKNALRS